MIRRFVVSSAVLVALVAAGCGSSDLEGDDIAGTFANKSRTTGSAATGDCDPKGLPTIEPHDPNEFPKCATAAGSARCISKAQLGAFAEKVNAGAAGQGGAAATAQPAAGDKFLDTCDNDKGVCIPDDLVKTGGAAPQTCTSLNGDGVCLDLSIPLVSQYKDLLPQDKCAGNQRCAPCANPLKQGEPTGACSIGRGPKNGETCNGAGGAASSGAAPKKIACPYTGAPIVKVDTLAACGEGVHCVSTSILPDPKMSALLGKCKTTDNKDGVCAPDEFVETAGNFVPKTCASLAGGEGRCMNVAVPQVASQKAFLPQDTCRTFERCTPCVNPVDGKPTGACAQSCDKGPQKPAVTFAPCAKKAGALQAGVCVPTSIVPEAMQTFLKQGTCSSDNEKCAPKDVIASDPSFKPPTCSGQVFGPLGILSITYRDGVCLSDLIDTPGNRGSCQSNQECVPCSNPISKKPTGAPGCK